jgi:nitroreductase
VIVLAGAYGKMVKNFPNNPAEVSLMEAGHIGQNIYLQVEALGMSTVVTAGFDAKKVGDALHLDPLETVAYLIPLGHRAPEVTPTPGK